MIKYEISDPLIRTPIPTTMPNITHARKFRPSPTEMKNPNKSPVAKVRDFANESGLCLIDPMIPRLGGLENLFFDNLMRLRLSKTFLLRSILHSLFLPKFGGLTSFPRFFPIFPRQW
jgi:hypothetical protein